MPLLDTVKRISPDVFKRLLASEKLQLQSENEAYHLCTAWLWQSPHVSDSTRGGLFKEMAPLLRYYHMSTDYLANIVSQCRLMKNSRLLPEAMLSALVQREASTAAVQADNVARGKRNRAGAIFDAKWRLLVSFPLNKLAALEPDEEKLRWCGLVAGYAAALWVQRRQDGDTLAAFLKIHLPAYSPLTEGSPSTGVALKMEMTLTPDVKKEQYRFFSDATHVSWGWFNIFGKPWAEAVHEGSPHFPDGKLEVHATVKQWQ